MSEAEVLSLLSEDLGNSRSLLLGFGALVGLSIGLYAISTLRTVARHLRSSGHAFHQSTRQQKSEYEDHKARAARIRQTMQRRKSSTNRSVL